MLGSMSGNSRKTGRIVNRSPVRPGLDHCDCILEAGLNVKEKLLEIERQLAELNRTP